MIDGLTAVRLAVDDEARSLFAEALRACQLLSATHESAHERIVVGPQFHYIRDMPLGDDEKMHRRP
jgi:hypothetical protein